MRWQTEVLISPLKDRITYKDDIIFIGSCFAAEIGAKMEELRFRVVVNPFGVLFNPGSISSSLHRIQSCELFAEDELIKAGDIYKSFSHGSEYASTSKEEFLSRNNSILKSVSNHYKSCRWVLLTLGTSWVYRERSSGKIVSNCHKLPHSFFERATMEVEEIVESLASAIEANPDKRWIITV
ncbi:MAG: GSCFA domain-containing protein, partial [Bacteroidales bacterium]|nr:GSCFA domain-containing protein [Bacteroidales bacterium]